MQFRKIVAACAAASMMTAACAVCAYADKLGTVELVTLNANSDTGKRVQYDINTIYSDTIDEITLVGRVSAGDDWVGGGGQIGYNAVSGWVQKDFSLEDSFASFNSDGTNVVVVINTSEQNLDPKKADEGMLQIGWEWGSGDGTFRITDIKVNGETIVGNSTEKPDETVTEPDEADDDADADDTVEDDTADETVEDDDDTVEEDQTADVGAEEVEEDDVIGDDDEGMDEEQTVIAPAPDSSVDPDYSEDPSKVSPDAGITDAAFAAGLGVLAVGAVFAAKKRK